MSRLRSAAGLRGVLTPATLALTVLLAGCAGAGARPSAGAGLTGTYWGLLEVDGNAFPDYQGTRDPYLVFKREGARVTGFAGCNAMGGGYEASGDSLHIGPLALTRMACLGEATAMESAFVRGLEQTASYLITDGTLELRDAAGLPRVRLEARGTAR